jgi:undecaprenyl-phosphate 4-deoxy-4-formamido-L-arabinose transferase
MSNDSHIELSVVIPVYRSAATLRQLVDCLLPVLDATGMKYEIVFAEDGSPDDSWKVLSELQAENPDSIVAIQLMRNFGQHNALMCGFRHARGRFVVTMDDDLQNPPREIPKLLEKIQEGNYDVVYGQYIEKKHQPWRNLGSLTVNKFYRLVFRSDIAVTSFRIIRKETLDAILSYDLNFTFVDGLLAWNTRRIGSVLVDHEPRQEGRSGYSLWKLLTLALNLFTNFSLLPLQVVSALGLFCALVGALVGFYYLIFFLLGRIEVPGYASTIVAILMLGGCQLLALGIMGEYLGRLHLNVNRKPQYTERQILGPHKVCNKP